MRFCVSTADTSQQLLQFSFWLRFSARHFSVGHPWWFVSSVLYSAFVHADGLSSVVPNTKPCSLLAMQLDSFQVQKVRQNSFSFNWQDLTEKPTSADSFQVDICNFFSSVVFNSIFVHGGLMLKSNRLDKTKSLRPTIGTWQNNPTTSQATTKKWLLFFCSGLLLNIVLPIVSLFRCLTQLVLKSRQGNDVCFCSHFSVDRTL